MIKVIVAMIMILVSYFISIENIIKNIYFKFIKMTKSVKYHTFYVITHFFYNLILDDN